MADFTYVATWRGVVYVAFVRRAGASMPTDLALDALEQALYDWHTDAGSSAIHERRKRINLIDSSPLQSWLEHSIG